MNPVFSYLPIIVIAVLLVVFVVSYLIMRRKAAAMLQKYETTGGKPPSILPDTEPGAETALKDVVRPAEAPAKKVEKVILSVPGYAESVDYGHPLGKKVLVIRSRFFSHLLLGLVITGVAVFGFYANIKGILDFYNRESLPQVLASYALLSACAVFGLFTLHAATYRVVFRHEGFEFKRFFYSRQYRYIDVTLDLRKSVENVKNVDGYRSFFAFGSFQTVWTLSAFFRDKRRTLVFKSTRYAKLRRKAEIVIANLVDIMYP